MTPLRILFVHSWNGFSLAEWCLREALESRCRVPVDFRALDVPPHGVPANDLLQRAIASFAPDIVGFSCHYWSTPAFLEASAWVKLIAPGARVALGGPQVNSIDTALALLERYRAVDWIVRGPGEDSIARLAEAAAGSRPFESVPGLSFRAPGKVVHTTPPRGAAWKRGPIFHAGNAGLAARLDGLREASYETMRGCRQECVYCVYPSPGISLLDDALVADEISWLLGFGIPHLRICDAHFGGSAARAKRILGVVARSNRRTSVKIHPDLAHFDDGYARLAREANAEPTSIGVQTTNRASLRAIRRTATHDHREAIARVLSHFPRTPADLIVGLPGDDPEGLERTFADVLSMGFRAVNVNRLRIFPGTALAADPPGLMGGREVVHTAAGQVLSSPSFPASRAGEVAALVHALEIAAPLERTRRLLAPAGGGAALLGLARVAEPADLMRIRGCLLDRRPALAGEGILGLVPLVERLAAGVAPAVRPGEIREAVTLDVEGMR